MKKTIKNTLVVAAMLGAITGYANLTPASIVSKNINTTMLKLDNVKVGQRLLIKSKNGTIIYKESIGETGAYTKEFDLTSLPDGNYFFELEKDMVIQIIPFKVISSEVEFSKKEEVKIFKPVVRTKNNLLYVSKLSLDLKPMTIEIYYDGTNGSEKIYTEKFENTKIIERVYSIDQENPGSYKIITKTDGRIYSETFSI